MRASSISFGARCRSSRRTTCAPASVDRQHRPGATTSSARPSRRRGWRRYRYTISQVAAEHDDPWRLQRSSQRKAPAALDRTRNPRFLSLGIHAGTGTHQSTIVAETATYGEVGVDGCADPRRWFGHSLDTHFLRLNPTAPTRWGIPSYCGPARSSQTDQRGPGSLPCRRDSRSTARPLYSVAGGRTQEASPATGVGTSLVGQVALLRRSHS